MSLARKHPIRNKRLHRRLARKRHLRTSRRGKQHGVAVVVVHAVGLAGRIERFLAGGCQYGFDGGVFPAGWVFDYGLAWVRQRLIEWFELTGLVKQHEKWNTVVSTLS